MTQYELERWQEHNRQVMQLGGRIITHYMADGHIEEYREVGGQLTRNDPERKTELSII